MVDYVLTVAVSLAVGAASLASVFPALAHHLLLVSLVALVILTTVNMFGIAASAKLLIVPGALFVISILAVLVVAPFHSKPVAVIGTYPGPIVATKTVGLLLLLKAFANGCTAITGVEAIANGVPAFRRPRVRAAQRTELALGVLLGVMLIGLAVLIRAHGVVPRGNVTILAQLTAGTFGKGAVFYVCNLSVGSRSVWWRIRPSAACRCRWSAWRTTTSCRMCSICGPSGRSTDTGSLRWRWLRLCCWSSSTPRPSA